MGVDVSSALRRGFDRAVTGKGLALMAAYIVLNVLFIGVPSVMFTPTDATSNAFILGVSSLAGFVLSMAVAAVGIRAFVDYDRTRVLQDYAHGRIGFATLNLVLGFAVASVIIGVGFILVIPGIYLLISLLFWHVIVAVDEEDFIDALRQSWGLTRGHKWRLLLLVFGITLVLLALNAVGALLLLVTPGILLSSVVSGLLNAFGTVFSIAVVADAYNQVSG